MNTITKFARIFSTVVMTALAGNAGATQYYAKAIVQSAEPALGKVYVSATKEKGELQEAKGLRSEAKDVTFYRWAEAEPGCLFVQWSDGSTTATGQVTITSTSTEEDNPTTETWTAYFEQGKWLYAKAIVESEDPTQGEVYVSTNNVQGVPQGGPVSAEGKKLVFGDVSSASILFYRWAVAKPGYRFVKWSDGSSVAAGSGSIPSTSTEEDNPTIVTWKASFEPIPTYYGQVTVEPNDASMGKVFVSTDNVKGIPVAGCVTSEVALCVGETSMTFYRWAEPKPGYVFRGWSDGSTVASGAVSLTATRSWSQSEDNPTITTWTAVFSKSAQQGVGAHFAFQTNEPPYSVDLSGRGSSLAIDDVMRLDTEDVRPESPGNASLVFKNEDGFRNYSGAAGDLTVMPTMTMSGGGWTVAAWIKPDTDFYDGKAGVWQHVCLEYDPKHIRKSNYSGGKPPDAAGVYYVNNVDKGLEDHIFKFVLESMPLKIRGQDLILGGNIITDWKMLEDLTYQISTSPFYGKMDDVVFINRPLTMLEMERLYYLGETYIFSSLYKLDPDEDAKKDYDATFAFDTCKLKNNMYSWWSTPSEPMADNDYIVENNHVLKKRYTEGDAVFAGHSLTLGRLNDVSYTNEAGTTVRIAKSGHLLWNTMGTLTINELILNNGSMSNCCGRLEGHVIVQSPADDPFVVDQIAPLTIAAPLKGNEGTRLRFTGVESLAFASGALRDYKGDLAVASDTTVTLSVNDGVNPETVTFAEVAADRKISFVFENYASLPLEDASYPVATLPAGASFVRTKFALGDGWVARTVADDSDANRRVIRLEVGQNRVDAAIANVNTVYTGKPVTSPEPEVFEPAWGVSWKWSADNGATFTRDQPLSWTDAGVYTNFVQVSTTVAGYEPVLLQSIVTIAKADYDMSAYRLEDTEYAYEDYKTFTLTLTGGSLPAGLSVVYADNTLSQVGSTLAKATFTVDAAYAANFNVPASQTALLTVRNDTGIALTVSGRTIQMKILGNYLAGEWDLVLCWGAEAGGTDSTNGWSHVKTVTAKVASDGHVIEDGVFWGDDEIPNGSKVRAFLVNSSGVVQLSSNLSNFSYTWDPSQKVRATLSGEGTYPYDGMAHGLSITITYPEDGEGCTVEWLDPPSYVEGGRHTGRVTVSRRGYEPLTLTGTITITPKSVVVTAENRTYSKVYGTSDPNFTYTLSREIPVVGALGRYAGEDVGTYRVTAGTLASESPSYKLVFNPIDATLEITKATYDLSGVAFRGEVSCTVAQLAETPKPYEVTGTLPAGVTVSYTGSGTTATAPGDYTVTAHFTGDEVNYEPIPDRVCALHVRETLDPIAATVEDGSAAYDVQPHGPSITITNPASGEGCTVEWFDENDTPCGATPPRYVEGGHHKSRVTVSAIGREDFSAEVITVISDNAFEVMTTGNDSSATGPFRTIKRALEVAKSAVTNGTLSAAVVRVHPGRYVESNLVLDFPVTVTGGGGSREKIIVDPVWGTFVPIDMSPSGAVRITSPEAVLTSLTVQNGRIDGGVGGNIIISAGVVSNCVVRNGMSRDDAGVPQGGNISMSGSALVVDTVFTGGTLSTKKGSGLGVQASVSGGTFRRCVFRDTTCALKNCSVIYVSGAARFENCQFSGFSVTGSRGFVFNTDAKTAALTLVNCTVVRNVPGGGVFSDAAKVTACNSVVYGNGGTPTKEWSNANASSFMNCAFPASAAFPDEISSVRLRDEDFAGFASGDYRPFPGGRLVGAGSKGAYGATGAESGLDLAGQPRFVGTLDLGAYELQPTALTVQLASSTNNVEARTPVTLTATAFAAKGEVAWAWSVNGGDFAAGTATYEVTPSAEGITKVVAKVTAGGETSEATNVIRAIAAATPVAEAWVGADGDDVGGAGTADSPFATIAKAKGFLDAHTNDAVQTIHVGAGFYCEGGVSLNRALVVSGDVTGPAKAVIHSSSTKRVFELSDDAARVEGVKVQGQGGGSGNGGLLTMASGTVSDCVITGGASGNGGNIYMDGGKLERCKVGKGAATTQGGDVWVKGGLVANSLITGGSATKGAGLYVSGAATVLNCTVVGNAPSASAGAGVFCASDEARVVNTVIYGNGGTPALEWGGEKGGCFEKCAFAAGVKPEGAVCVDTVTDGAFVNCEGGDFRLSSGSVLIGGGTSWIDYCETYGGSEADTDLGRNPRKRGYYLDVGCYQHLPLATVIFLR